MLVYMNALVPDPGPASVPTAGDLLLRLSERVDAQD
jgi:hypothetical protein